MTGVGQSHSSPEWVEQAPLSGSSGTEGVPEISKKRIPGKTKDNERTSDPLYNIKGGPQSRYEYGKCYFTQFHSTAGGAAR